MPIAEGLEARRLLAVLINEFDGTGVATNPAGITTGPDGNLWFTEANPSSPGIGRITPSGAIENFTVGLNPNSSPIGITEGPDGALWFADSNADMIGRIDTTGTITEFPIPTASADPEQITLGSDGALWFTEHGGDKIGRITTAGVISQFAIPTMSSEPSGITTGSDGNLWFTEQAAAKVARITPLGVVTEFSNGITAGSNPDGITAGSDGRLWFTEEANGYIGAITDMGVVNEYTDPSIRPIDGLVGITHGPDGNLWFTALNGDHVDKSTTAGFITQYPPASTISAAASPTGIVSGPDDALWFTEPDTNKIGRVDTSGKITEFSTGITAGALPFNITLGPVPVGGGTPSLWFTESGLNQIGEISTSGSVSEFGGLTLGGEPDGITLGPDGNLWFTENSTASGSATLNGFPALISINSSGSVVDDYTLPAQDSSDFLSQIVTGPDGALWFTMSNANGGEIGRVTTAGVFSFYPITNNSSLLYVSDPVGIVAGANNTLWFADQGNHAIGEITTGGAITEYSNGLTSSDVPDQITAGPDGNYWFSDPSDGADPIGSITPAGVITLYQTPTQPAAPMGIALGPDHNIWFTEAIANQVGQAVLSPSIISSTGTQATVEATVTSSFTVATFSDASGATNSTNFSAMIDYGDGFSGPGTILPDPVVPGSFEVIGTHKYSTVGPFVADITISTATSIDVAVSAGITSASPITLSPEVIDGIAGVRSNTLVATFTDADSTAVAGDFSAEVTWSDGTFTSAVVHPYRSLNGVPEFAVYAGRIFTGSGSFINQVFVEDARNFLSVTSSFTAAITAAPTFAAINEIGPAVIPFGAGPNGITLGPDQALWFTESTSGEIGRIDTSGNVTQFAPSGANGNGFTPNSDPTGITLGPDGALWFTETGLDQIARITTTGLVTEFAAGITAGAMPDSIVTGPDGNLWFTEVGGNRIGRITPQGVVTEFSNGLPTNFQPDAIALGPDNNLWFVGEGSGLIGRITPAGVVTVYMGATGTGFTSITQGPDGDLWFTEPSNDKVGKINPLTFQVGEYADAPVNSPTSITSGPDGRLYFTSIGYVTHIGQITTAGVFLPITTGITPGTTLAGIATGPDGNVYFAESNGDRIGQVVLPQTSITSLTAVPFSAVATQAFTLTLANFTEASIVPTTTNFQAVINWGDGSSTDTVATMGANGQFSVSGTHTYANSGPFGGSITILNDAGSKAVPFLVNVAPVIVVSGISISVPADRTFTLPVATFTDAGGPRPAGSYNLIIDWGDLTTSAGTLVTGPNGQLEVVGTHDYPVSGTYEINVIVELKNDPTQAGSSMTPATVTSPLLFVSANSIHASAGIAFQGVVSTFFDENANTAPLSSYQALIDWGDGSPLVSGSIAVAQFGGFSVSSSHLYAKVGTYFVTVVVKRIDTGDVGDASAPATIGVAGPINEVKAGITGSPVSVTTGPDGAIWFTESEADGNMAIGRITTGGAVTEFTQGLNPGDIPGTITTGPDGNLWFTLVDQYNDAIGRITPNGLITLFSPDISSSSIPGGITTGPDGALWFTSVDDNDSTGVIGRITTAGAISLYQNGLTSGDIPRAITLGPDGNLWFTVNNDSDSTGTIGKITPSGTITEFPSAESFASFNSITSGPDGALWFTVAGYGNSVSGAAANSGNGGSLIGRITTSGTVTEFSNGLPSDSSPQGITTGADGNLWFVDSGTNEVDRITTGGVITPFGIPSGNSAPTSIAPGIDDNLWFNEPANGQIGQVVLPQSVVGLGATIQGTAGQPVANTIVAYFSDRSSLVDLGRFFIPLTAFGDGSLGNGALVTQGGLISGVEVTHTYATAGYFGGVATLTDAIGTSEPTIFTAVIQSEIIPPPPPRLTFVVTNTNDSGPGSLRQAILNANEVGGHAITFAIPVLGVATIGIDSPLPVITGPTVIDGPSQAAFEGIIPPYPLVEIDGQGASHGLVNGLVYAGDSAGSDLLSVSIYGFSGTQVVIGAPYVTLLGNEVGLRADGAFPNPLQASGTAPQSNDGIEIIASGAVIGGTYPGEGNVIGGNSGWGILLAGPSATFAQIVNDKIGLDPTGTAPRGNGLDGIAVIGGAGHEFLGPADVISGNSGNGILLLGSSADLITGDAIGTDASGSRSIANGNDGIDLDQGSNTILIGGMAPFAGNLISGDGAVGVAVVGDSNGVVLQSNLIGTDATGEHAVGNGLAGVLISNSPGNVVGPGDVVSGNGVFGQGAGIWIDGGGSTGNLVVGDKVGTDVTGEIALGNAIVGLLIDEASGNEIGGGASGSSNVISGNLSIGLMIAGPGASNNLVASNLIGTDIHGSKAIGNGSNTQGAGVYVDNASSNTIGGGLGLGNLISGNGFDGAQIFGPGSTGNLFEGNDVGTDASGTLRLGNGEDGLLINDAPATRIVGNFLAANALDGVTVSGPGSTQTLIQGNTIGRGLGGQPLGNGTFGILVINGAPMPNQVANVNVNNTLGPFRDTALAAAASSSPAPTASTSQVKPVVVSHGKARPSGPRTIAKAKVPARPTKSKK